MKRKTEYEKYRNILAEFNDELGPLLKKGHGRLNRNVLNLMCKYADKIAMMHEPDKWKSVSGKKLDELPFELQMLGLSLLASMWTSQIFNLKARDRKSTPMLFTYMDFKATLYWLLNKMEYEVWRRIDPVAEGMYIADLRRFNQTEELKRIGIIPSLCYNIKKRLGLR